MSIKVSIPADYASISLKQFKEFKTAKNDVDKLVAISNLSKDNVQKVPVQHVPTLLAAFDDTLLNESAKFFETIAIKNKDFGFIPNLYEISLGEYADISTWAANVEENIVKIMSVLYRPITKRVGSKYIIEEYNSTSRAMSEELVEQMTLEQFNGAMLFFSTLLNELSNTSLDYLETEVKKLTEQLTEQLKEQLKTETTSTKS
jgi:hypothetical protein